MIGWRYDRGSKTWIKVDTTKENLVLGGFLVLVVIIVGIHGCYDATIGRRLDISHAEYYCTAKQLVKTGEMTCIRAKQALRKRYQSELSDKQKALTELKNNVDKVVGSREDIFVKSNKRSENMIKKILFVFLFGMFIFKPALANDANSYSAPNDAMTFYYQNKDINRALEIIQQISDAEILEHNPHGFTPLVGFVLGVIKENAGAEEQIHNLTLSPAMQRCVAVAEDLSEKYSFEEILTDPTKIQDERGLDLLWGVFFATGNPKIPETIHNFVENNKISKAPNGQKSRQDVVVMSAIWSLESNAEQHETVKPYAEFPVQSDNNGSQNIITFYQEVKKRQ